MHIANIFNDVDIQKPGRHWSTFSSAETTEDRVSRLRYLIERLSMELDDSELSLDIEDPGLDPWCLQSVLGVCEPGPGSLTGILLE